MRTFIISETEAPSLPRQELSSDYYTWTFPGSPVRIRLAIDVVERLLPQLTGKSEVYGILIGRAETPVQIEVTDFRPIPQPDGHGSRDILAEQDWDRVEDAKAAARAADEGVAVVGYYRRHDREGLRLEKEDLALMRAHFAEPSNVCLLMKPAEKGAGTAGFFFWDNGVIESGFSFNEFPFDPERLRVEAMEQRLAALRPVSQSVDTADEDTGSKKKRLFNVLLWPVMAGVLAGALVGGYYAYQSWRANSLSPLSETASVLALRVQTQGEDLRLSWNRNAPALRAGNVRGILTILDGDFPKREIPLGPDELISTGSILYTPLSKSVQFRMVIEGAANTVKESVLALKGSAAPAPPVETKAPDTKAGKPPATTQNASHTALPVREDRGQENKTPALQAQNTEPARSFVPSQTAPDTAEAWRQVAVVPEAPSLTQGPAPTPASWLNAFRATPPAPARVNLPVPSAAAIPGKLEPHKPDPASTSVEYTAPKPTRQVQPTVSSQLRTLLTRDVEVNVKVIIDATGKVKHTEVASGNSSFFAGPAISAARLWLFEPATRNGQNVESEQMLTFRFRSAGSR